MKLVYCAMPSRMLDRIEEILHFVESQGCAPFHPFLAFPYSRFEGGLVGREKTMSFYQKATNICDEFWLFGISKETILFELPYVLQANARLIIPDPRGIKPVKFFFQGFDTRWREMLDELEKESRAEHPAMDPIGYIRKKLKTENLS